MQKSATMLTRRWKPFASTGLNHFWFSPKIIATLQKIVQNWNSRRRKNAECQKTPRQNDLEHHDEPSDFDDFIQKLLHPRFSQTRSKEELFLNFSGVIVSVRNSVTNRFWLVQDATSRNVATHDGNFFVRRYFPAPSYIPRPASKPITKSRIRIIEDSDFNQKILQPFKKSFKTETDAAEKITDCERLHDKTTLTSHDRPSDSDGFIKKLLHPRLSLPWRKKQLFLKFLKNNWYYSKTCNIIVFDTSQKNSMSETCWYEEMS